MSFVMQMEENCWLGPDGVPHLCWPILLCSQCLRLALYNKSNNVFALPLLPMLPDVMSKMSIFYMCLHDDLSVVNPWIYTICVQAAVWVAVVRCSPGVSSARVTSAVCNIMSAAKTFRVPAPKVRLCLVLNLPHCNKQTRKF